MSAFVLAALLGLLMKIELIAPGKTIMDANYNGFFTFHGSP
jgi:cytochrome c oxidase subunit 1